MCGVSGVIRIKLNQLVYKNVHTIISLSIKRILSAITVTSIFQFYLQDGLHTERHYVTVTLCIGNESVPKIIINDTIYLFLKLQSGYW